MNLLGDNNQPDSGKHAMHDRLRHCYSQVGHSEPSKEKLTDTGYHAHCQGSLISKQHVASTEFSDSAEGNHYQTGSRPLDGERGAAEP